MEGNSKALFKKYCSESSILGLKYFYLYPDRASRCFWAVVMIFSAAVTCLISSLLYQRFSEIPTWITIENHFEHFGNLPYPAITICSPNQITVSALTDLKKNLVNGNLSTQIIQLIHQYLGLEHSPHEIQYEDLEQFQNIIELNRYTVLSIIGMIPQRCNHFLKRCVFQQKMYPCEDLFEPILTRSGICCTFNSIYYFKDYQRNERKTGFVEHKVKTLGYMHGLSVLMDYNPQDAIDNTVLNAGATKVLITDYTEFPGLVKSHLIHPGAEAFFRISFTYNYCSDEVESLPVSSRNCYFADEYHLPHFEEYRNSDCDLSCFINEVEEHCRCTPVFVPFVSNHPACNFTKLTCLRKVKFQMSQIYNRGQCSCLRNCKSRQYDREVIIGNLEAMEHFMENYYSDLVVNETSTLMYFYFPTFFYNKHKQETAMSLISLGSNLGGVVGLGLGCSIISFLEIWFYMYIDIKNRVRRHLIKRRQRD